MSVLRRLQPLHFRVFEPRDLAACMALFRANADRFPAGYERTFADSLREGQSLYLVAEDSGEIVACGGISYLESYDHAWLSFGTVDPARQRRGIGTTLLLARLALLEPDDAGCLVSLHVTAYSFPFYRRFGFEGCDAFSDDRGNPLATFYRLVRPKEVRQCRAQLARAGAMLPASFEIPIRTATAPAAGGAGED